MNAIETIVKAMECSDGANDCIVVLTNETDMVIVCSSSNVHIKVGLLEAAKAHVLRRTFTE